MEKEEKSTPLHDEDGKFAPGNKGFTRRKTHGRPPKASRFIEAFRSVVERPHPVGRAIIHTDKDLLAMTNRLLDEEDRIALSTWERYKRGDEEEIPESMREDIEEFAEIYQDALLQQRDNLFERMTEKGEARSWGRWSWIIERKFDEWNLRQKKVDETPDRAQLVFRVDPESSEGRSSGTGEAGLAGDEGPENEEEVETENEPGEEE